MRSLMNRDVDDFLRPVSRPDVYFYPEASLSHWADNMVERGNRLRPNIEEMFVLAEATVREETDE